MKSPFRRRLSFHPFYRVQLVQMLRHDEVEAAIRLVGNETLRSVKARLRRSGAGDGGVDHEILMVPCDERLQEIEQAAEQTAARQRTNAKEVDHGWER